MRTTSDEWSTTVLCRCVLCDCRILSIGARQPHRPVARVPVAVAHVVLRRVVLAPVVVLAVVLAVIEIDRGKVEHGQRAKIAVAHPVKSDNAALLLVRKGEHERIQRARLAASLGDGRRKGHAVEGFDAALERIARAEAKRGVDGAGQRVLVVGRAVRLCLVLSSSSSSSSSSSFLVRCTVHLEDIALRDAEVDPVGAREPAPHGQLHGGGPLELAVEQGRAHPPWQIMGCGGAFIFILPNVSSPINRSPLIAPAQFAARPISPVPCAVCPLPSHCDWPAGFCRFKYFKIPQVL